jgi:hypothetical protein
MASTYKVTSPFVNATVADSNGAEVTLGFYEDQFIENAVEGDHLDKLVRAGYVEKVSGAKANAAEGDSSKASSKS